MEIKELIKKYGTPYSLMLGIDLQSKDEAEIQKWFLASILYAKPIREESATATFKQFDKLHVTRADVILQTGWDGLVKILDAGGYTRYDFSTATKLLSVFGSLKKDYGSLTRLEELSENSKDLEMRIKGLGKGIGYVTISIFLRDMRLIWNKADPSPTPLVKIGMKALGIDDLSIFQESLERVQVETALSRIGMLIRRGKWKKE
ncbi:MAG: hypothetical protein ACP5T2_05240 [Thermoprotei archaeon]